jgi:hypothetical protein
VVCLLVQRPVARGGGYGGFPRGGGGGGFRGGGGAYAFAGVCCIVIRQSSMAYIGGIYRWHVYIGNLRPVGPEHEHAWRTVGAELEHREEFGRHRSMLCMLCVSSSFKCSSIFLFLYLVILSYIKV